MKITKRILSVMAAVLILTVSCLTAVVSADENTLTFNDGKTANVGDTITYTFSLSDCPEPLVGIQMYIYYNPEYLQASEEYETDLSGAIINPTYIDDKGNGQVIITASDIGGMDYSSKKSVVSIDFKVLKGGESDITYYVTEMYTMDESGDSPEITPLSAYAFHQDITVNGSTVSENETPKLEKDDSKFVYEQVSNFVNNEEGKSDGQSTYVPSVEATEAPSENTSDTDASSTENVTDSNGQTVTQPTDENGQPITSADENTETEQSQGGVNVVLIIVIIAAVVVVVAVILLFATKKKK